MLGVVDEINFKGWTPGWVLYFEVEDFEVQCKRAEELGGAIVSKTKNQCLIKDPSGSPIVLSPPNAYSPSVEQGGGGDAE